ncbi:16S rRNA (uracil(1498)-N(3))-methyltransferase, partial [Streptomyces sp. NPDC052644]
PAACAEAAARPNRRGRSVRPTPTAGPAAPPLLLGRTGRWS